MAGKKSGTEIAKKPEKPSSSPKPAASAAKKGGDYILDSGHSDLNILRRKVIMQGKLFQRCTHLLYCSVLSLGGNVNTRRMSKPDMGSIFHIKNQ